MPAIIKKELGNVVALLIMLENIARNTVSKICTSELLYKGGSIRFFKNGKFTI